MVKFPFQVYGVPQVTELAKTRKWKNTQKRGENHAEFHF